MVTRERNDCIQIAELNPEFYMDNEMHRRIYSVEGAAPSIRTHTGGGAEPKILIERSILHNDLKVAIGRLSTYDDYGGHNVVYSVRGGSPTILLNASKGYPPLIVVEDGQ
jgi:hypothetical protein